MVDLCWTCIWHFAEEGDDMVGLRVEPLLRRFDDFLCGVPALLPLVTIFRISDTLVEKANTGFVQLQCHPVSLQIPRTHHFASFLAQETTLGRFVLHLLPDKFSESSSTVNGIDTFKIWYCGYLSGICVFSLMWG